MSAVTLASIPSPSTAVWHLGPLPVRAYALCIVVGIIVACYITEKRMRSRGAPDFAILDIAVWAVPFGIVGARIYHVITSPAPYFGRGGDPAAVVYIWNGGLGIWGAVAGGGLGAWIACRRLGIPFSFVADAIAPALPIAQGIGRFGNWFNNELYGRLTTLPWGLKIHEMDPANPGHALVGPDDKPLLLQGLYHPTFLYEAIWDIGTAVLVFALDRRYKFGKGRAFALYVMVYTVGRGWVEYLRIDPATHFLGLRINDWTSIVVFLGALAYFLIAKAPASRLVDDGADGLRIATGPDDQGGALAGSAAVAEGDAQTAEGEQTVGAVGADGNDADDGADSGIGDPDSDDPDGPERPLSEADGGDDTAVKGPTVKGPVDKDPVDKDLVGKNTTVGKK